MKCNFYSHRMSVFISCRLASATRCFHFSTQAKNLMNWRQSRGDQFAHLNRLNHFCHDTNTLVPGLQKILRDLDWSAGPQNISTHLDASLRDERIDRNGDEEYDDSSKRRPTHDSRQW